MKSQGKQAPLEHVQAQPLELPDALGCWDEDGEVAWMPRAYFSTRGRARGAYSSTTGVPFAEVRVLSRWMRHAPEHELAGDHDGFYWLECDRGEPGAFAVWRCE